MPPAFHVVASITTLPLSTISACPMVPSGIFIRSRSVNPKALQRKSIAAGASLYASMGKIRCRASVMLSGMVKY